MKAEDYMAGLVYPSGSGSNLVGFTENSPTHPSAIAGGSLVTSLWEGDTIPRAILE